MLSGVAGQLVMDRARANGAGSGLFSQGSDKIASALSAQGELGKRLEVLAAQEAAQDESAASALKLIRNLFAAGLANQVVFQLPIPEANFDTHAPTAAKEQPELYKRLVNIIDEFLTEFKNAEVQLPGSNLTIPLRDCCSFTISSEFGRTLRQRGRPIVDTGTDHNPQGNSVLVGGSGIRPGLVIGSTDLSILDGSAFASGSVSEFHRRIDPDLLKVMGLPYDFASGASIPAMPAGSGGLQGDVTMRINFANILNTVASIRGVPRSSWLRSGGARPQELSAIAKLKA